MCALYQVTSRTWAREGVRVGRGGGGERAGSQDWGREEMRQMQRVPSPAREQRAAGKSRGCWDACKVLGPSPSPAPHRPAPPCPFPGGFVRRKKTALWFVGALLVVSASILTVGLAATTRTENVTVGGYYPGIVVSVGSLGGGSGAQDTGFRVVVTCATPAPQRCKFRRLPALSDGPVGCRVLRSGGGKESEPRSAIGPPQGVPEVPRGSQPSRN